MSITPPLRFIIYVDTRVGATFLSHCLSTHLDVFCLRIEPFHSHNPMCGYLGREEEKKAEIIYSMGMYYKAAGFKANYGTLPYVYMADRDVKVIHLMRKNVLRGAVSLFINATKQVPTHSFEPSHPDPIEVDMDALMAECEHRQDRIETRREELIEFEIPSLEVDYSDMVGRVEGDRTYLSESTTKEICQFVGVEPRLLFCKLARTNPRPLDEMVVNYDEVEEAARDAGYGWMLEEWMTG